MRYAIAIIFALLAGWFVAANIAPDMATDLIKQSKFQSPDQVDDYEAMLKISIPLVGAAAGFLVGWLIGGLFDRAPKPSPVKRSN
jgi:F0F1-type ATP synthase assembly protein I